MRNRPVSSKTPEQKFIEGASTDASEMELIKEDLHQHVGRSSWPLDESQPAPSMARGSDLKKPMLINLSEKEWNSVDRHTKSLGVSKQGWLKHAIYKLLESEQLHFLKLKNRK